jgi:hypothetical protein
MGRDSEPEDFQRVTMEIGLRSTGLVAIKICCQDFCDPPGPPPYSGSPHYSWTFYLRIHLFRIKNWSKMSYLSENSVFTVKNDGEYLM